MTGFPIDSLLPEVRQQLARANRLVLQAAPGAGKTTRIPLALLDCDWLQGRRIILLEPRRLAARAAARFMAHSLGESVGETVGYRVRLDSRVSAATRIEVVTEGVLTRQLQSDPELSAAGLVIFDEFHERSLQADLGLALCLDVQSALRDDLRLLVMSATLDGTAVSRLLGDAGVLRSEGRSYPVDTHYRPLRAAHQHNRRKFCHELARQVLDILAETRGSLLVFLPGAGEIREVHSALRAAALPGDVVIAPLMGQLDAAAQDIAIQPAQAGQRKLVLATAIAETSLTIEGVTVVIDAGLSRQSVFDPNTGLDRLITRQVTADAARQRSGRAGRLGPGRCYRLWPEHQQLAPRAIAEIMQADLTPLVLELALWGTPDIEALRWLDAPPPAHVAQAREILEKLGAIGEDGTVTAHGRRLAGLGVHPRLAHMMVCGQQAGYARLACELAALLSERDPPGLGDCDMQTRVEWLRGEGDDHAVIQPGLRRLLRDMAKQWLHRLGGANAVSDNSDLRQCGNLLAYAYPDRIAQRRPGGDNRFLLSNGRGARFREAEPLSADAYLVAARLDGEQEALIRLAASIQPEQIRDHHGGLLRDVTLVCWDKAQAAVVSSQQVQLGKLVIEERPLPAVDEDAIVDVLIDGIRQQGIECLPWTESARRLQQRAVFARQHAGDDSWPDLGDDALLASLQDWLRPYMNGMSRLTHLKKLDLRAALLARLNWAQQQLLDRLAPARLQVPSGSLLTLDYSGERPVLAVRLQEMFGLADTPRIADGKVQVLLHLLSPARRPVQITRDLAAFWSGSYAEVRKDMKGRYPKHPWPENPLEALPTRRAKSSKPR